METPAVAAWRRDLEAWALPQELLDSVPDSPYGLPPELFRRRADTARDAAETATTRIVRELAPAGGSVLDIGAGAGRASLPLAEEGFSVTAVERSPGMLAALAEEVAAGANVQVVEGSWPDVAEAAGAHDVAMCAHVVYDVQAIAPFIAAMHTAARCGVSVELTLDHPWSGLSPYYRALHDLDRPAGPTVDDLATVVEEVTGVAPRVERWTRSGSLRFESLDELLALYRRRLLLPEARMPELEALLAPAIVEVDGRLTVGPAQRELATVWWQSN